MTDRPQEGWKLTAECVECKVGYRIKSSYSRRNCGDKLNLQIRKRSLSSLLCITSWESTLYTQEPLWGITTYFNPARYRTRLANYKIFREHLNVPLIAVEYVLGEPELTTQDAEILVQIPGRDVMWQKERLLNVALEHLPEECRYVAWLDCDIVFEEESWSQQAIAALEEDRLIQLFSEASLLERQAAGKPNLQAAVDQRRSLMQLLEESGPNMKLFSQTGLSQELNYCPGYAWAAPRDVLEQCRFYDAMIVGGADKAMV